MPSLSGQQAGGKATALKLRAATIARYLANPVICLSCGKPIPVRDGQKVSDVKVKRFCNQQCNALFHASKRVRKVLHDICRSCGKEIPRKRRPSGQTLKREVCDDCRASRLTKADIFSRNTPSSSHSVIRSHARAVYLKTHPKLVCEVCSYSRHAEVCHKKPVKDFPPETKLTKINAANNLVALCPNHHWEFDHPIPGEQLVAGAGVEPSCHRLPNMVS
jgi:RNA polymerase-binding transcription factor DksA